MAIVAAVDRSGRAAHVISEAESLARAFDEPIHVVHTLTRDRFVEIERVSVDETGEAVDLDRIRNVAREIAADAAAATDVETTAVGLVGDPPSKIVEYADEHDVRYIVVSGRKRSPAGKILFGSVTQSILLNANCPVVSSIPH
ncbi:universal stress protein [Natronorarus salvus]|uniref:universal stress protein n=1 Tax=Natronorarus salvus TaxID=3117733 RepID=UPI002F268241